MKIAKKQLEDLIFEELQKEGLQDFIPQGFEKFRVANNPKVKPAAPAQQKINDKRVVEISALLLANHGKELQNSQAFKKTPLFTKYIAKEQENLQEQTPFEKEFLKSLQKAVKQGDISPQEIYDSVRSIYADDKGLQSAIKGAAADAEQVFNLATAGPTKPEASDTEASAATAADREQEVEPGQVLSQAPAIQLQSAPGKLFQANLIKLAGNDKEKRTQISKILKALISDLQKSGVNNLEEAQRQEVVLAQVIPILKNINDQAFAAAIKKELVDFLRLSKIKLGAGPSMWLQGRQNTSATAEPAQPAAAQPAGSAQAQSTTQTQDQEPADAGQAQAQPEQLPPPPAKRTLVLNPNDTKILGQLAVINKSTKNKISPQQLKLVIEYLVANGLLYYNEDKIQEKKSRRQRKQPQRKNAAKRERKQATARPIWQQVLKQPTETIVKDPRFKSFVTLIASKIDSRVETLLPFMTALLKTGKLGMPQLPKAPGEQDSQEQDFGPPEQSMGLPSRIPLEEKKRWQKLAGILKD